MEALRDHVEMEVLNGYFDSIPQGFDELFNLDPNNLRGMFKNPEGITNTFQEKKLRSKQQNILLIDNNKNNLLAMETLLFADNRRFIKAESSEFALEQLLRNKMSVILCNADMPNVNGLKVAELVRKNKAFSGIPVLLFVDKEHTFNPQHDFDINSVEFIQKPIAPTTLTTKIDFLLDLEMKRRQYKLVELTSKASSTET